MMNVAVYGLQADVESNPNRFVQLYVPGKTQLSSSDVFLGGPGTGVTDDTLNGATRVFGDDRQGTAKAYDNFINNQQNIPTDYASNLKSVIAANNAPRSDGKIPTGARLDMENRQVQDMFTNRQNGITNKYNQDKFDYGKGQDAIVNDLNERKYGEVVNQDTFSNLLDSRKFDVSQDQFNRTLASTIANQNANRKIDQQRANYDTEVSTGGNGGTNYSGSAPSGVADVMSSAGVPPEIWGPIMDIESSGDPNNGVNLPGDHSIGLFALNMSGGLGNGYSESQLKDPTTNASIAAKVMGPLVAEGQSKGLTGLDLLRYVAYNGGWPTQQGVGALSSDQVVKNYDKKIVDRFNNQTSTGGTAVGGRKISQSSSTGTSNTDDAILAAQAELKNGTSPGNVASSVESQRSALTKKGINVDKIISAIWDGLETTPGEL